MANSPGSRGLLLTFALDRGLGGLLGGLGDLLLGLLVGLSLCSLL
jgi:hypothetical protein